MGARPVPYDRSTRSTVEIGNDGGIGLEIKTGRADVKEPSIGAATPVEQDLNETVGDAPEERSAKT